MSMADSVDSGQTPGGSLPNSPPPPPPTKTLDEDLHNLTSPDDDGDVSKWIRSESRGNEVEEEKKISIPSPINTYFSDTYYSDTYYSWSSGWTASGYAKPSTSHLVDTWDKWPDSSSSDWLDKKPSMLDSGLGNLCGSSSSYWLDDEKPSKVGAGLGNLGNTCFLNAVMQCFTHTVVLVQGLRSYNHAIPCHCNSSGFCVLCAFRDHIVVSLTSTGGIVYPRKFVENLSYLSSSFQRYQQEDAHEFLQFFLDRLDSCCSDSKIDDVTLDAQEDDNFVKQTFGGRLVSKLKCGNCAHFSNTYEPSIDLSLEIDDVNTLQTALESFTKLEKLEDPEAKFTCENCKEQVSVEKQLLLDRAPKVAAFHLKRFKNNGSYVQKIDKCVEFPLELDLTTYTTTSQDSTVELKYDLYAVVVHIGFSSTSGHYYCFIRSASDTWYKFDDSRVVRVREDYVLSQEAYILFYTKQGTPWFSSYLETLKPFLDLHISNTSPKSVLDDADICTSSSSLATASQNHDVGETSSAADEFFVGSTNGSRNGLVDDWADSIKEEDDWVHRIKDEDDRVDRIKEEDDGVDRIKEEAGGVDRIKGEADAQRMSTTLPPGKNNTDGTCNVDEVFEPSVLQETSLNQVEGKTNTNNTPQTPPRYPNPDINKDQSPVGFSSKRDWEGSETKEARRLLKSLPGPGSKQFLAAVKGGPRSEDTLNHKRRRSMEVSPHKDDGPSRPRQKAGLSLLARSLAAGFFR